MSQFWEQQLHAIREQLLMMSGLTERNLAMALRALVERDDNLSAVVEAEDSEIDQLEIHIDELVVTYVATHGAVASVMRFVLTASKIAANLERIADEATTIARRARDLNSEPLLKPLVDIPIMAEMAQEMLHRGISAFVERKPDLALEIVAKDREVDDLHRKVARDLRGYMHESPQAITRALHLLTVAKSLERAADRAANIAEEVYYMYRGKDIRHDPALKARPA